MTQNHISLFAFLALGICSYPLTAPQAADLGGDCCTDLVERIAELEDAPRKPNRKVSLRLSNQINRFIEAGLPANMAPLLSALNDLPSGLEFEKALNRLAPKAQFVHINSTLRSDTSFGNALMSCSTRDGDFAFVREGQCAWARTSVHSLKNDANSDNPGLDQTGFDVSGGAQFALSDTLRLGFAIGYENTDTKQYDALQDLAKTSGDRLMLGAVLKNRWGPLSAAFAITGNFGWYDHERYVNLDGVGASAFSDQNTSAVTSKARFSYLFDQGGWYVKPMVDVSAMWLRLDGYQETGANGANLAVDSADEWLLSVTPALEFGGEINLGNGTLLRPYVRAGVSLLSTDEMDISMNFINAPTGIAPIILENRFDNVFADIEAGMTVLFGQSMTMKFSYEGRFAEHTRQHAGALKIGVNF